MAVEMCGSDDNDGFDDYYDDHNVDGDGERDGERDGDVNSCEKYDKIR